MELLSKKDCLTTLQKRVESIMHVITSMRSDVAYSFRVVSRYQSDLNENHWKDIKTIFKYLRNTKDQ